MTSLANDIGSFKHSSSIVLFSVQLIPSMKTNVYSTNFEPNHYALVFNSVKILRLLNDLLSNYDTLCCREYRL